MTAEVDTENRLDEAVQIEGSLREAIAAELDLAVHGVYLKPPRWIVKSTAGQARTLGYAREAAGRR